jgi:hypothetical protein
MLNACLTFSWPNNAPFDNEAGRLFGPSELLRNALYRSSSGRIRGHDDKSVRGPGSMHMHARARQGTSGFPSRFVVWLPNLWRGIIVGCSALSHDGGLWSHGGRPISFDCD